METFEKESFTSLYTTFGAVTTDTTKTAVSNSGTNPLNPWQAEISKKLEGGSATVVLLPMGGASFGAAIGIKMTVTLNWTELGRAQSVTLSTVRF